MKSTLMLPFLVLMIFVLMEVSSRVHAGTPRLLFFANRQDFESPQFVTVTGMQPRVSVC